jgi:hypothetical protein
VWARSKIDHVRTQEINRHGGLIALLGARCSLKSSLVRLQTGHRLGLQPLRAKDTANQARWQAEWGWALEGSNPVASQRRLPCPAASAASGCPCPNGGGAMIPQRKSRLCQQRRLRKPSDVPHSRAGTSQCRPGMALSDRSSLWHQLRSLQHQSHQVQLFTRLPCVGASCSCSIFQTGEILNVCPLDTWLTTDLDQPRRVSHWLTRTSSATMCVKSVAPRPCAWSYTS